MYSPLESCEQLRFLGFRLIEILGRLGPADYPSELDLLQWKIAEHRHNCPNCVAFDRRRRFCVLRGGAVRQQSDADFRRRYEVH